MERKTLAVFGCGHLSVSIFSFVNFYLLKFYTDVVHLDPALVGYAFGIQFFTDALTDPLVGYASDHSKNRMGRRRPYMFVGSISSGVLLCLVFMPPTGQTWQTFLFLAATLSLLFIAAGVFQITYDAFAAEITYDYTQRIRLSGYRKVFDSTGDILGVFVVAVLLALSQGEHAPLALSVGQAYFLAAACVGAIVIVSGLVVVFGVREPVSAAPKCAYPFWQGMRNTWSNRPFRILLITMTLGTMGIKVAGSQLLYVFEHYFHTSDAALPGIMLTFFAGTMLCIPIWMWVTRSMGKKRALVLSLIFEAVCFALLPAYLWPSAVLYPIVFLMGAGMAGVQGIALALWPDVIEWDELRTGERREGSYAAMQTFATKISLGFAMITVGQLLSSIGYRGEVAPSNATLDGLRIIFATLPACLLIAGAFAMLPFPITRESHQQTLRELGKSQEP